MENLNNKVVVITGGNSGIGLATAKQWKQAGAMVITNARNAQRKEETLLQYPDVFDSVIIANLASLQETREFIQAAAGVYSGIDVLYLNAGIAHFSPIEAINEQHYSDHFDLNVKSLLFSVQYALPYLK